MNRPKREKDQARIDQARIDKLQIAMRVLGVMVPYSVSWTVEDIWSRLVRVDTTAVKIALTSLLYRGHVQRRGDHYTITTAGRDSYEQARLTALKMQSTAAFKEEVLTGMDDEGEPTQHDWAALPTCRHMHQRYMSADIRIDAERELKRIANDVGMPVEQTREAIKTGEVHVCRSCGKWARFHAHNSSRHKWRSNCIHCRKARRK